MRPQEQKAFATVTVSEGCSWDWTSGCKCLLFRPWVWSGTYGISVSGFQGSLDHRARRAPRVSQVSVWDRPLPPLLCRSAREGECSAGLLLSHWL